MSKSVVRLVAFLAVAGVSSSVVAGGHGFVMRQGGAGGGMRMARGMPPVAGTWHVRTGRSFFTGQGQGRGFAAGRPGMIGGGRFGGGYGFGHTNTAPARFGFAGRPAFGYGQGWYGHTATQPNGFVRVPSWSRYGVVDRGRLAYRSGRYPHVPAYGYGYGGGFAYGDGYGSGGSSGFVPVPYPVGGYAEPVLASQYSEPALNQQSFGGYGSYETEGPTYPSVVGTGGPHVIVVNNNNNGGSDCHCHATSPVVYRYGVGTYY